MIVTVTVTVTVTLTVTVTVRGLASRETGSIPQMVAFQPLTQGWLSLHIEHTLPPPPYHPPSPSKEGAVGKRAFSALEKKADLQILRFSCQTNIHIFHSVVCFFACHCLPILDLLIFF